MKDNTCIKCLYGRTIPVTTDLLCKYRGVVSYDYSCSKFMLSPWGDRQLKYCRCDSCDYFCYSGESGSSGECRLFGIQGMDGCRHKGCGRYRSRYQNR